MLKLKADVLVTAIFLTAALLFFLVPRLFDGQMDEAGVEILLDGELLERYPLSEDRTSRYRERKKATIWCWCPGEP